jgi:catechol 2,3-dioxygenase-like lactoylglutathione lyase family enzyme
MACADTQGMTLELRRAVGFARDLPRLAAFYRDVLGLPQLGVPDDPRTWCEFVTGACMVALHGGGRTMSAGRGPKLVFYVPDVAAARAELNDCRCNSGRLVQSGEVAFRTGSHPEGTVLFQSSRV